MSGAFKRIFLGNRKDFRDPGIFHRMALIPFLAWVGLGADGLSSSSYGPAEAWKALRDPLFDSLPWHIQMSLSAQPGWGIFYEHTYLGVFLALAMALTVIIISASYSQIIRHFPHGGGGYLVASRLLGPRWGVTSGSALLVDYVLTITTSVAAGADAVFSFLPEDWSAYKVTAEIIILLLLILMNVRGVKESVVALMPIFVLFLITHAVLIGWGVGTNIGGASHIAKDVGAGLQRGHSALGTWGLILMFLRSYSLGGGTYTGIEAVSNGLAIMRAPRVETGRRTMVYMAVSLAVTAGGILLCYKLHNLPTVIDPTKTMNAILAEEIAGKWHIGGWHIGPGFIITTLVAEGALLFVAAQAGFIDGPRVMANMAVDSWLPHRFSSLSDRLTTQNGVLLMGGAAIAALWFTQGAVDKLVVMYSINVFVTFSLSQAGMVRFWVTRRADHKDWKRHLPINLIGFLMCVAILVITVAEKFLEGGYMTLAITSVLVGVCFMIRRHYNSVRRALLDLDKLFEEIPIDPKREELGPCDPARPTAALLVGRYGGLGVHSMLTLLRMFPKQFTNIVFISVGVLDSGNFKGKHEVETLRRKTRDQLGRYVGLARRLGLSATFRVGIGTDVIEEAFKLCQDVVKEFPQTTFFSGTLIFEEPSWYHRILHNETANAIQHRLQFAGHAMVVLPVRVRQKELAAAAGSDFADGDDDEEHPEPQQEKSEK
jgi:amino acid transporter